MMDLEEKKRLVIDLYQKKLMYKCFAGWANQTFSVSDDEEISFEESSEGD